MKKQTFLFDRVSKRVWIAVIVALLVLAVGAATEAFASTSASGTPSAEEPHAEAPTYQVPQGPLLPDAEVSSIARHIAALANEQMPTDIRAVDTTLKSAIEINPQNVLPAAPDTGMEALENSTVVVVSMHGEFTLNDARIPQGKPAPTGTVLTLILDAHTGQLEGREIGNTEAPGIAALGASRVLE
jgi:hypothetical protein